MAGSMTQTSAPRSMPHHRPLLKHKSWSPDMDREEAWERRKDLHHACRGRRRALNSLTDDDFDELRGCIDLGMVPADGSSDGGDCPSRLAEILPALDPYLTVRRGFYGSVSTGSSFSSDESPAAGSPLSIFSSGSNASEKKTSLKKWAQAVACSVRQRY